MKASFLSRRRIPEGPAEDYGEFLENPAGDPDGSVFLHSLQTITQDELAPDPGRKKRDPYTVAYAAVRFLLLALCLCVFVWSGYTLVKSFIGYRQAEDLYAELADLEEDDPFALIVEGNASPSSPKSTPTADYLTALEASGDLNGLVSDVEITTYNEKFEKMKSKLNTLAIKNPDTYGWIRIDNTVIDYPIMQCADNEYYLSHAYTGNYLQAGSIFADYRCYTSLMKNYHLILYGHNMRNGLMFNNVMNYLDKTFFDENPYIEIYTFDGIYTYEVFAIYETRYDYDYIRTAFPDNETFFAYCEKLRANSLYEREGVEFTDKSRLLTLSTCTNNVTETGRYALHAVLVKKEK